MLDNLKKLWKAKSILDEIKKLTAAGFSWKHALKNAATNFGIICGSVAVGAIADYFQVPANVGVLFSWLPDTVRDTARGLLEPVIATTAFTMKNWSKNRKNEIVWVVPVKPAIEGDRRTGPTPVAGAVPVAISVKPADIGPPPPPPSAPPLVVTGGDAGA